MTQSDPDVPATSNLLLMILPEQKALTGLINIMQPCNNKISKYNLLIYCIQSNKEKIQKKHNYSCGVPMADRKLSRGSELERKTPLGVFSINILNKCQ